MRGKRRLVIDWKRREERVWYSLLHRNKELYRVVQLNLTPEIEVFYMVLTKSFSIFSMTSLKRHTVYSLERQVEEKVL